MGIKPLGQEKHNFTIVFQKKKAGGMLGNELLFAPSNPFD